MKDQLADASWPKFLHPYPLSEKYFLVAAKPTPQSLWGIYLVDVFDNMVLVKELPGYALLEPIPLRKTPRPPVIPEKVDPARKDATVYIADIYAGQGLQGIPRGTVKSLRVFTYHFAYRGMVTNPEHDRRQRPVGHQAGAGHGAGLRGRLGASSASRPTRPFRSSRWTPKARRCN